MAKRASKVDGISGVAVACPTRTVEEVIEDIGYGPAQLRANLLVNGSWLADGSEALMISALTKTLAADWHLAPTMQGGLSSVVYLGTLLGSLVSGWIGDTYGRRPSVLLCFPLILGFSLLSAGSAAAWQLLALRFMVGLGFGVGQPNSVALLVEVSPLRWRTLNQGLAQVAFAVGELFCCLLLWLDDPTLQHLRWRWMLAAGAIPAAMCGCLAWVALRESPAYLAARDPRAAREELDLLRSQNGSSHASLDFAPASTPQVGSASQLLTGVLGRRHLWKTCAFCAICFSYNLTIYGAFFALPQLLPNLDVGMSPVAALAAGALIEIPFDFLGVALGMWASRKQALGLSFLGVAISLLAFARGSEAAGGRGAYLHAAYFGLKGFPQISSLVLYVFASESFPVALRASGTALVLGVGRLGAVVSPLVYEWTNRRTGGHAHFFALAASLTVASILILATLPETFAGGQKAAAGQSKPKTEEDGLSEDAPLMGCPAGGGA